MGWLIIKFLARIMHVEENYRLMLFFTVEADFVVHQKKILALFEHSEQLDAHSEYYKLGKEYNIEANINKYTVSIIHNDFNVAPDISSEYFK